MIITVYPWPDQPHSYRRGYTPIPPNEIFYTTSGVTKNPFLSQELMAIDQTADYPAYDYEEPEVKEEEKEKEEERKNKKKKKKEKGKGKNKKKNNKNKGPSINDVSQIFLIS